MPVEGDEIVANATGDLQSGGLVKGRNVMVEQFLYVLVNEAMNEDLTNTQLGCKGVMR